MGFNDGPLLHAWRRHRFGLWRWLARVEAACYERAYACSPDVVIRLTPSADVALQRKPDMWAAEVERRIQAVSSLTFPARTIVVDIDADAPLEEVLRQTRRAVWAAI